MTPVFLSLSLPDYTPFYVSKSLKKCFASMLFLACYCTVAAQSAFPVPPDNPERLFYLQRTGDANTLIYEAITEENCAFNTSNPVRIYWIKYAEKGQREDLNYLQRKFAYGLKLWNGPAAGEFYFQLVSYNKLTLHLKHEGCGKPVVSLYTNGREMYLERIFINLVPAKMGKAPKVNFIEVFGTDPHTGARLYEKFLP